MAKRIFKILGIVIMILLISAGYYALYQRLQTEISSRKLVERNLKIQMEENKKLLDRVNSLREKINQVERELDVKKEENQRLKNIISQLNDSLDQLEADLALSEQEKETLLAKLAEQSEKLKRLEEDIKALIDEREVLRQKLADLSGKEAVKERVELEKVEVVAKEKPQEEFKPLTAQIMAINREFRFLVLNLGEKDGVEKTQLYNIVQDEKTIAKLKPDRVYESLSVFDIVEQYEKLEEGQEIELLPSLDED